MDIGFVPYILTFYSTHIKALIIGLKHSVLTTPFPLIIVEWTNTYNIIMYKFGALNVFLGVVFYM